MEKLTEFSAGIILKFEPAHLFRNMAWQTLKHEASVTCEICLKLLRFVSSSFNNLTDGDLISVGLDLQLTLVSDKLVFLLNISKWC